MLDNAKVLYYTPAGDYGAVYWITGEIAEHIVYLAICRYPASSEYYLFGCNAEYEVVSDSPFADPQECMRAAQFSDRKEILWIRA